MRAIVIRRLAPLLALATLGAACTIVSDDDDPFGSGTAPVTTNPPATDTGDGTTTSGSGSTGGSTTAVDGTGAPDSSSSGLPPTTGVSAEESSEGGNGNGMQPDDGMWSACAVPEDCGFAPTLCITITAAGGGLLGGFCSETGCSNPAVDCDPSPVPTVSPVCVPVTVDGMADSACALQCTGGAACPVPMQCLNVTGIGEVCA
jgi:hypothetical protein